MRILPFRGARYASAAGDPGALAAPPFDQINPTLAAHLHASDPHHFAHLTRPDQRDGLDPAAAAARLYGAWVESGVVERDAEPAVYPYEIEVGGEGRWLGLCALVGVEPPGSGVVRPHEHTVPKTIEERLGLLRATGVDLEPILLLSEDPGTLEPALAAAIAGAEPLVESTDAAGFRHRLFRVDAPERVAQLCALLAEPAALIADGHHRYRVAQRFAEEAGADPAAPSGAKLAVVTSVTSSALTIDPIHRLLGPADLEALAARTIARRAWDGDQGSGLAAALTESDAPELAVWDGRGDPQIWTLDPATGPADLPPAASRLAVVLLHHALLPEIGLGPEAATDGTVQYRSDADELYRAVAAGEGIGVWLPPMTPQAFAAAIAEGDLLPPKSTRFVPKLVSGLVWSPHDDGGG